MGGLTMGVDSRVIEGDRRNGRLEQTRGDAFVGTCLHESTGKMDRRVFHGTTRQAAAEWRGWCAEIRKFEALKMRDRARKAETEEEEEVAVMPTVKKPAEGADREFVVMVVGGAPIYIVEGEDRALDICEALEAEGGGKRALTERERQVLDMWPRFEDGERVWFGDGYTDSEGRDNVVQGVAYVGELVELIGSDGFHAVLESGERVKRPAPKALDADGVEIRVGDKVRAKWNEAWWYIVTRVDSSGGITLRETDYGAETYLEASDLTHTPPDSWERLEEDVAKGICEYFGYDDKTNCNGCPAHRDGMSCKQSVARDIIRRAKALVGVE